jgi:integrase
MLLGCGLRRSEAVNLRFEQLQLRESYWVIIDMVGKGGRLQTVQAPDEDTFSFLGIQAESLEIADSSVIGRERQ